MKISREPPLWKIRFFWVLLFSALFLGMFKMVIKSEIIQNLWSDEDSVDNFPHEEALRFSIYPVLLNFGIRMEWFGGSSEHKIIHIPGDLNPLEPYVALINRFRELHGEIIRAETNPRSDRFFIQVGLKGKPLFDLTLIYDRNLERQVGNIALVVDDFGHFYNDLVEGFLNMDSKITFAVIPGLPESKRIAEMAAKQGHEVLIHMPMEAMNRKSKNSHFILLTSMQPAEIRQRLRRAIKLVPHAVGLNNHMGSQATVDGNLLAVVMDELKNTNLFFLDSRTNSRSLAFEWAVKKRVPALKNDSFLDVLDEKPYIKEKLYELAEMAVRKGYAIGIGHPGKNLLSVFEKEIPNLKKKGFKFITLSKIFQERRVQR